MGFVKEQSKDREAAREARLAAARAARTATPKFGPEERIAITDLRPGDFLVAVPTQKRLRGLRYGSLVADVREVRSGERLVAETVPVSLVARTTGVCIGTARTGGAVEWGTAIWPVDFEVLVRRNEVAR